jgi:hypothetical protein
MLVYLMKQSNFDLMYNITCFSRIVFDEFIAKGGEIVHKVVVKLLLTGWLREET